MDCIFTILLAILGTGVIFVFTQMHRNPILGRITDSGDSGLGWEFYVRLISLGALPMLTWLAYQFPAIGNAIVKFIEPAQPVIR